VGLHRRGSHLETLSHAELQVFLKNRATEVRVHGVQNVDHAQAKDVEVSLNRLQQQIGNE